MKPINVILATLTLIATVTIASAVIYEIQHPNTPESQQRDLENFLCDDGKDEIAIYNCHLRVKRQYVR